MQAVLVVPCVEEEDSLLHRASLGAQHVLSGSREAAAFAVNVAVESLLQARALVLVCLALQVGQVGMALIAMSVQQGNPLI